MSATPIDLSRLPVPDIVETISYEVLLEKRKAEFIARFPEDERNDVAAVLKIESEPLAILAQEHTYREIVIRQRVNDAARSIMLAYAAGTNLEHLAALFDIERLTLVPGDPENGTAAVMERDPDLRKRIQLAPQGFSVAGPEGAYISHALNADGRVLDASVTSPAPCEVLVTILSREGDGTAASDLLAKVSKALRDDDIRPLTDKVTTQSAEIKRYRVRATLYTFSGPDSSVVLTEARKRLAVYAKETHRNGREVTLSGIYAALHVDGVERVQLDEPVADIPVAKTQAPYCIEMSVTHGGIYG
ncbi:baseplate J/gp47 family protein [Paraburkholderia bonniea]|uniref:baseplate J/gp47 family protein n=1 Tax=Paraburkholderia bonniea TaxID=2152891 RepID=UPI0012911557|nr:baseplate J/gp47 family protein [Paraburkholderia bonniea]